MSDGADWHDPFADDEEARERERRRAEREARRGGRQGSLGEKVAEQQAAAKPPPTEPPPATPPPSEPAVPPSSGEPGAEPPPADPPTALRPPAPAPADPPTALQPPATPPPVPPESGVPAVSRSAGGLPPRRHDTTRPQIIVRRVFGLIAVIALAAIVAYGAVKVLGSIGGDDEPEPGPSKPLKVEDIVVPEGLDHRQIADVAKDAGLKGDYAKAVKKAPKGFDLGKYGAADAPSLEGFLFPATYEVERDANVETLIDKQLQAFEDNLAGVDLSYAKSKNLTTYDVLIIASMIEREIQVADERDDASAVIYNRLKADSPLGIDATIRYEDQNYDEQLTESRLDEDTPYNTRTHPGLPPTPIGNPGLASIKAAANPAKSDVFYFVVKPGTCGEHVFVESEEEFAEAEAAYQQALAEEGGSPTEC